jgi:hypothetical protein
MLGDLDAVREVLASQFGVKISRSSLVYNVLNDALPDLTAKLIDGQPIHKDWKNAPGMPIRRRPGRPNKRLGCFKGKREKLREVRHADVA